MSYNPTLENCTGISDEDIEAMARRDLSRLNPNLKAIPGKAIVWIAPFRKEGVIEVPWDFRNNSSEAVIVSDGSGLDLPQGTRVMVHPEEGIMHEVDGVRLCFVEREALLLAVEA